MRVLFLGTPDFALPTLKRLMEPPFELVGVVTQPDRPAGRDLKLKPSPVKVLAQEKGFKVWTPEKISPQDIEEFTATGAEVAVVVAFGQILTQSFLDAFPKGAVNVHASILPRWRGAGPIQWALLADDEVSGVALQRVVRKLDAGDIIGIKEVKLSDDYDAPKLYAELSQLGADLVGETLPAYVEGKLNPVPQDESHVTIAPKISKSQGLIDWNKSAREIFAQYRGLKPWPGTWTFHQGKMLKVISVEAVPRAGKGPASSSGGVSKFKPGQVISIDKDRLTVATGNGALTITMVQPESRSAMKVSDYVRGRPMKEGDQLGQS